MTEKLRSLVAAEIRPGSLGGIPTLFASPERRVAEWRELTTALFQSIEFDRQDALMQAEDARLVRMTRDRLEAYAAAQEDNLARMKDLMQPLGAGRLVASQASFAFTKAQNTLLGNYTALLRDWAWETDENEAHFAAVRAVLPPGDAIKTVLVPGAGGCRMAFDLARHLRPEIVVATEINPLTLFAAKRVLAGERLSLWEFPALPLDLAHAHRLCELSAPEVRADVQPVFADFLEDSFEPESFDLVLTPWFIDVLPVSMTTVVSRINQLLRPGGVWVNFGPLMIPSPQRATLLTKDEVLHLAKRNGFAVEKETVGDVPQLHSELWPVNRLVTVATWAARKVDGCPVVSEPMEESLPPFLLDTTRPIDFGIDIDPLITSHELISAILKCAKHGLSVDEAVRLLNAKIPAGEDQIRALVVKTLRGLYLARRSSSMLERSS